MLKLTNFVQIDTGIHVITAFAMAGFPNEVKRMEDVQPKHLDAIADYLEPFYSDGVGQSLAAGIAFTNSGFAQASWNDARFRHKRRAYASFVLRGHQHRDLEPILSDLDKDEYRDMVLRDKPGAPLCAFTGQPAYLRISRDMLPMLNGRGVINFGGNGLAGLPVSDLALLAIHAMPLGCVISQGRLLAVESDDPDLVFAFVRNNLDNNRRNIAAAQSAGWKKLPNQSYFKTTLIKELIEVASLPRGLERYQRRSPSLTAYHFSNSGTDPKIDIYALPSAVVDFVITASRGMYQDAWLKITARAQQEDKPESEERKDSEPKFTQRNYVYEDLFGLPDNARSFIRTYFMRQPMSRIKKDVRSGYNLQRDADLISWELTDLFLKRMMNVEKSRVDHIRTLGDRLARHISERSDKRLLNELYNARDYRAFRLALLRAIKSYSGDAPLVEFDGFVSIFEEAEEFARLDWNLARDLLLIRIFEQLYHAGQLALAAAITEPENPSQESA